MKLESKANDILKLFPKAGGARRRECKELNDRIALLNKPCSRGGVGVEVPEVFREELWFHFFWPTFWLHCILYFTYEGGFAPRIGMVQNAM